MSFVSVLCGGQSSRDPHSPILEMFDLSLRFRLAYKADELVHNGIARDARDDLDKTSTKPAPTSQAQSGSVCRSNVARFPPVPSSRMSLRVSWPNSLTVPHQRFRALVATPAISSSLRL